MKCDFTGCKCEARWAARKLFGDGGTLNVCDKHKPDADKRPEKLRHLPFFYDVQPITEHLGPKYPTSTEEAAMGGGPW